MKNQDLATDYIKRARSRLKALDVYYDDKNWADVVHESQELCELVLKAVLRRAHIDPPPLHDLSAVLEENASALPTKIRQELVKITEISRSLHLKKELAFYGSEDLTPSDFYQQDDATEAREWCRWLLSLVEASG